MAILSGLGFIIFPIAEFASGQIYAAGGYYAVYATSLAATVAGLAYVAIIPESVTARTDVIAITDTETLSDKSLWQKFKIIFKRGNMMTLQAFK